MFDFFLPSRKPTPSEYAVLVVFVSLALIILGIVAIVVGFREPASQHDLAVELEYRGAWCLGIGIAIGFGFWLVRRIMEYL